MAIQGPVAGAGHDKVFTALRKNCFLKLSLSLFLSVKISFYEMWLVVVIECG